MIQQLAALDISEAAFLGLVVATVQFATLLYLAALGEAIAERSGVLNLGVEGMMAVGAVCGYIGAVSTGSPWLGLLAGAFAGACAAGVHAIFAVGLGADQVVSGLALTILGLGMANFIGDSYTDDTRRSQFADVDIPVLSDIPWVGETVLSATPVTYLAVALGIGTWFVMNRTGVGLGLRAVGESASTADAAGHSVLGTRAVAVLVGGAFAGLSGAYLTTTAIVGRGARASRQVAAGLLLRSSSSEPGVRAVSPREQCCSDSHSPCRPACNRLASISLRSCCRCSRTSSR